ncbi:ABC-transporter, subfamily G member 05 [Frankliniella occidentalis]|nr:ABC-transporter, subfamily G member 05 [Frankliniella occidentalis]
MTVTTESEPLLDDGGGRRPPSTTERSRRNGGLWWSSDSTTNIGGKGYGSVGNGNGDKSSYGADDNGGWTIQQAPSAPLTYTWTSLDAFAPGVRPSRTPFSHWLRRRPAAPRKHLLKNVSGAALPGEVLAIMGASGAGKTTLLDALTFRSDRQLTVTGARALSGTVVTSSRDLANVAAYVQQHDLFVGWLTVREHLVFQALLRMERRIPRRQRLLRVREVMEELGLTKCEDSIIGVPGRVKGISGGEMKRLSFASEVLTDPTLLLCDEPTSGLDAYMAQTTVEVLTRLARRGKTVVLTIHQPSSEVFAQFDKILLMAEGRVAFLGSPQEAQDFFGRIGAPIPPKYNPADFFVQLLAVVPNEEVTSRDRINRVCDAYERSEHAARSAAVTDYPVKGLPPLEGGRAGSTWLLRDPRSSSRYKASWATQFAALLWRSWLSVRKDPLLVRVRVLQTAVIALLVSFLYFGQSLDQTGLVNINAALFTTITNMTFQNVLAVIKVFCTERAVFKREHMAAMYRVDAYFLARSTAELPIFMALPVLYTCIVYFAVGFNADPVRFFTCVAIVNLIGLVATSFGYFISCAANNMSTALSTGAPAVIPLLLYGGFFVNLDTMPSYFSWIQHISWFRYGNEALLVNQWQDVPEISCAGALNNNSCVRTGHYALQVYSFKEGTVWSDIGHLALLILLFRSLALGLLIIKTR